MAVVSPPKHLKRPLHRRTRSNLDVVPEETSIMAERHDPSRSTARSEPDTGASHTISQVLSGDASATGAALLNDTSIPTTPGLSRSPSFSASSAYMEDSDGEEASFFPPVEQLTMFDFIENLALTQRVEKLHNHISHHTDRLKKAARARSQNTRDRAIEEWRRRVPTESEQLERYKKRMRQSVDRLSEQFNSASTITIREKASFIAAVLNIFVSGYLVGGRPEWFPLWYSLQLLYFMPIRWYTYHKKGYHYFLADLCYFVNFLLMLSIWVFPRSKRLFISTYCLAFGNNAIAIVMWRNSLVFHSMDKVVSLFIHIMPCVTLHCIVHLLEADYQLTKYPAIYNIRFSSPESPHHYSLLQMMLWATIPYAIWQLSYHLFITVRRREQIAAGRPTSFTWLLKSYSKTWIGKLVLSLPKQLQEPAFMLIQYSYACVTLLPCPFWFWSRWASGIFLIFVFAWSTYNGANYYIEVFGKRFQKELETLKKDVAKWQNSPEGGFVFTPGVAERDIPILEGATASGLKPAEGTARERK